MAKKISQLTATTVVTDTVAIPGADGGNNVAIAGKYLAHPDLKRRLSGPFSNIWTRQVKGEVVSGATSTVTASSIAKAPCTEFTHVRVVLKNMSNPIPTIDGIILAVTNSATTDTQKVVPSVGNTLTNNPATGWVQAKFSGSTTITLPAKGSGTKQPGVLVSDWMAMPSITPTDGTSRPYIMARGRCSTAGTTSYSYLNHGTTATMDQSSENYIETFYYSGDALSTPQNMTSASGAVETGLSFVSAFEFLSAKRNVKILSLGDSITSGQGSTINGLYMYSWFPRAIEALRTNGWPVDMVSGGWPGATTQEYYEFGCDSVTTFKPDIALYSVYSPNDNGGVLNQATADTQYGRAIQFADYCLQRNCLPVFVFCAPTNTMNTTDDNIRKALIARAKASGVLVCDMTTAVGDGATPERFVSGTNTDNLHPNDTGYGLMAMVAQNTLQDIMIRNLSL